MIKNRLENIIQNLTASYKANKFIVWFFVVLWLALSSISSHKDILYYALEDEYTIAAGALYLRAFLLWTLAACFIPFILYLAHKFPIDEQKNKWRNITLHLAFSLCFLFVLALVFNVIFRNFLWQDNPFGETLLWVMYWYNLGVPVAYWFIIGGLLLNKNVNLYNMRRKRAVALQSELKEIQLKVLQMQLRPHFLFNALSTVNALIYDDNETAQQVLKKIRAYLELSFSETDKQEITLEDELFFTNLYLDIEKERYSDRLQVKQNVDSAVKNALVPNMLLQPLVENAVRHGIAKEKRPGLLIIRALQKNQHLLLEIEDSGKGMNSTEIIEIKRDGLGIKNTTERLEQLYNTSYGFDIDRSELGGCKVSIQIPLKYQKQPLAIV